MGIWNKVAQMSGTVLKGTGKTAWNVGKTATGQTFKAVTHPVNTLKSTGSALKTVAIGGGAAYVGWEKLTTDKSVARIVGDTLVGEDAVDQVKETMNDVKDLKEKAGEAVDAVGDAMTDVNSKWSGMTKFMRGLANGEGLNMFSNFFGRLGNGNVSGLSIAGLVASAFLIFGRFGWLGKIAGAMLGMMMIGNNAGLRLSNPVAEGMANAPAPQEEKTRTAMHR